MSFMLHSTTTIDKNHSKNIFKNRPYFFSKPVESIKCKVKEKRLQFINKRWFSVLFRTS